MRTEVMDHLDEDEEWAWVTEFQKQTGLTVTLIKTLREKNGPVIIYLYFCTMGMLVTLPPFARAPLIPATAVDWAMVSSHKTCA